MADLREAFQYASQNPTSDFARNLEQLASSGALDVDAKKFGIDLSPFKAKPEGFVDKTVEDLKKRGSNIADEFESTARDMSQLDVTSPTSLMKTQVRPLETVLRSAGQVAGGINDIIGNAISSAIPDSVKEKASSLFDTPQGQQALGAISKGMEAYNTWAKANPNISKDLEAVLNVASVIPVTKGGSLVVDAGIDATKAGLSKTRPIRDFTVGMASDALKKGKTKVDDLARGVDGATLSEVVSSPEVHPFITSNPANVKAVEEALKQGFEPKDVKFMASIQEADKETIKKMKDLAEKASGNLRIQERPIDIVGENGIKTLRDIQNINSKAGADVDATARALAGQTVDTSNLSEQALKLLSDSGITITMKQNGQNVFDFSKSIFKKTPAIAKTIERALSDLPNLSSDAYDLHKFKKSLDEVVNFGTSGEGLSGKAEGILKQIRGIADDTLDTNFSDYNLANTNFRKTRELLDEAHSLMGKKTDFLSSNAKLDFGQTMRSLFSNNKTRGRLTTFLDNLQKSADEFGVSSGHNLTDQALFSQILESVYGTQAVTGLQGEVGKAIGTAMKFKTNPLGATIETGINALEKARNITPEAKKKVLDLFMNQGDSGTSFKSGTVPETVTKTVKKTEPLTEKGIDINKFYEMMSEAQSPQMREGTFDGGSFMRASKQENLASSYNNMLGLKNSYPKLFEEARRLEVEQATGLPYEKATTVKIYRAGNDSLEGQKYLNFTLDKNVAEDFSQGGANKVTEYLVDKEFIMPANNGMGEAEIIIKDPKNVVRKATK